MNNRIFNLSNNLNSEVKANSHQLKTRDNNPGYIRKRKFVREDRGNQTIYFRRDVFLMNSF